MPVLRGDKAMPVNNPIRIANGMRPDAGTTLILSVNHLGEIPDSHIFDDTREPARISLYEHEGWWMIAVKATSRPRTTEVEPGIYLSEQGQEAAQSDDIHVAVSIFDRRNERLIQAHSLRFPIQDGYPNYSEAKQLGLGCALAWIASNKAAYQKASLATDALATDVH